MPIVSKDAEGLEIELAQIDQLSGLAFTSLLDISQPQVAGAFEAAVVFHLRAADLIDDLVDQCNDVKLIEGDRRPRQAPLDPHAVSRGHVNENPSDVLGASTVDLKIGGELIDNLALARLCHCRNGK